MNFKINKRLLPVKAHFFFFFAALGPLLPQLNVFGKQLGVSPAVMGMVTALLPLFWAAAKPCFGYVVDYWPNQRKLIFMTLITLMTGSYCGLWFIPLQDDKTILLESNQFVSTIHDLNDTVYVRTIDNATLKYVEKFACFSKCFTNISSPRFDLYLMNTAYLNTVYIDDEVTNASCSFLHMGFEELSDDEVVCAPSEDCRLFCVDPTLKAEELWRRKRSIDSVNDSAIDSPNGVLTKIDSKMGSVNDKNIISKVITKVTAADLVGEPPLNFYMSSVFWVFVVLICVGTVSFNVANCIGDAVCFDVLGSQGSKYGSQRAWGTAGYGLTALLGGWLVDRYSDSYKDFTPAFLIALVATALDLYSCRALTLPRLSSPEDGGKALRQVLKIPRVLVFIAFAVVAGIFDSFIIYYMFWYLEEIAENTGHLVQIKLIEGVVVAAQSFIGELSFFFFSGKIIKRWGYGATLTFSLFCYGVRMLMISLVKHPWQFVFIEGIMQGPTYALCYSTIVGYAAHVAPEGYSATVQGVVAGMDDGVGFAIGSLVGGQLYTQVGGQKSFLIFSIVAVIAAALHAVLFTLVSKDAKKPSKTMEEQEEKMLQENMIVNNAIYRDTVEPLGADKGLNSVEVR